jgi:hypothetical protein
MIKYIKTPDLSITHEDQEVHGLRFFVLYEENNLDGNLAYVRVTGEEVTIETWKSRVNGIEITEQELQALLASIIPPLFSVSADKLSIVADGVDTSKITVLSQREANSAYVMINGPPVIEETLVDGIAEIEVTAEDPGLYKVEVAVGTESKFIILEALEVT